MSKQVLRQLPIDSIKVGERVRQDLGDIPSLAASMKEQGLLQPLLVNSRQELVFGERRLEAARLLGWTDIHVIEAADYDDAHRALLAERDENSCRKDMTPSEKVGRAKKIEPFVKQEATARMSATQAKPGVGKVGSGKFPEPDRPAETRDIVGSTVGWSGRTYDEAKKVVEAAEDDSLPDNVRQIAQKAVKEMDETGKVSPAYRKVAKAKNPNLRPKHPSSEPLKKQPGRTLKQGIASLRHSASTVDVAASGFETDIYGDLSRLVAAPEAQEWLDLLMDATQRLSAHLRTVRRYQREAS